MEKKLLFTGIVLLLCISVIIGVVFKLSLKKTGSNPLKVVPQDAAYVIKLNGLQVSETITDPKTEIFNDLKELPLVNNITKELNTIDSLFISTENYKEFISNASIYISGHYSGGRTINHLLVISVPLGLNERNVQNFLDKEKVKMVKEYTDRKYEGNSIYSITFLNGKVFYVCLIKNVLIVSGSPVLIEDAIRQSTLTSSLLDNSSFADVVSTTGKNKSANIYIDLSQLSNLSSLLADSKYASKLRSYNLFGSWIELDVNIKRNLVLLNGFALKSDDAVNLVNMISSQEPVNITVQNVLPSTVSSFLAYGISDPEALYKKYMQYLKEADKYNRYQANLNNLNSKYGIQFEKFFLSLMDNEMALAYSQNSTSDIGAYYMVFKCKSGNDTKTKLLELTEKIGEKNSAASTKSYSPDNSISFNIYKIPVYPLFGWLLGDYFNVFEECYFTVVDNYLVVAGSYKDASNFIYSYLLNKTLGNDEVYRDFAEDISMKSYALAYINLMHTPGIFSNFMSDDANNRFNENGKYFSTVQACGFQLGEVSRMPYFNIFLKRYGDYRGKPQTVWESLLDTTISFKPAFVVNHYNNQNEIIIQDNKNNLYLINQAGRILWKVPLTEPINSEIYQIDYYLNKKLQILFSTDNYIYLLDRNGNNVEDYPIRLRSKSTTGLALFDYDNNRNYRIAIPCEDKKVYLYSKEGAILSGWNFKGTDYFVKQPVQHFRVEDKDYIVLADKYKTYILDRKGDERVILKKEFKKSERNSFYLNNTGNVNTSYLVSTDINGFVYKLYLDGNVETLKFMELSDKHFFDYKDINADGKSDFIFLDNNELSVYTQPDELLFSKQFNTVINHKPVYYHFSYNNRKIGLVSDSSDEIYLLNSNGDLYKGFPLEGKTLFSIGYFDLTSSRFNLIVGGRNNFLYNYAVE